MLKINDNMVKIEVADTEFSLFNSEDLTKINAFLKLLSEKINSKPTVEKIVFFSLLKYYICEDEIDFSRKTKQAFTRNFLFDKKYGVYSIKDYDYINIITLSVYVPEFYETINEIFIGEDVNGVKIKKLNDFPKCEEKRVKLFWSELCPAIKELEKEPLKNATTLLLVDYLKMGGDNIPLFSSLGYFYSGFRKYDVIEEDSFDFFYEDKLIEKRRIHTSKDMIVWYILNRKVRINKKNKVEFDININEDFMKELERAIEKHCDNF